MEGVDWVPKLLGCALDSWQGEGGCHWALPAEWPLRSGGKLAPAPPLFHFRACS